LIDPDNIFRILVLKFNPGYIFQEHRDLITCNNIFLLGSRLGFFIRDDDVLNIFQCIKNTDAFDGIL